MKTRFLFIKCLIALFAFSNAYGQAQPPDQFLQTNLQKANAGDPAAMNLLGNLYANGSNGVSKNLAEAKKWYQAAAEKGYPAGNFNMGLLYERGEIVAKDMAKALGYFKLAADAGLPAAKKKLESLAPTQPDNRSSASAVCFVMDSNNTRWATGGKNITSCDPAIIGRQITEDYGTVMIWQFKNDKEILRTTITSRKMKSAGNNNSNNTNTYERIGNKITENTGGCKQTVEIVSDTPQALTVKTIGATGNCVEAIRHATEQLAKKPPIVYLKIKG
jgi:hypothetical protein